MESDPAVFDISSDDEPAIEEPKVFDDDGNWLTELLRAFEREKNDDSDEVAEHNSPKPKSKSSDPVADVKFVVVVDDDGDDDDNDCVMLDGDPDKPIATAGASQSETGSEDGDDVHVVAEKGQIACRDYPHPRHLCVEFPFDSTPHERHCHLCHCYVCDSLAPCGHWVTGHCHATDKQGMWKTQRENYRRGKDAPKAVSKLPDTPDPMALPQPNQVSLLDIVQLKHSLIPRNQTLTHNPILQNQGSRTPIIRPCSSTLGIPNIFRQSRSRQSGCVQGRNRLPVSQQSLGVRTNVQQDRCSNPSGQRIISSNTMFKRPGLVAHGLAVNHPTHVPLNMNYAPASGYARNVAPPVASKENPSSLHYVLPNANFESHTYQSSLLPNMGSVIVNTVPSIPEVCSQPIPQSNDGQSPYQLENEGQNVPDLGFSDFDFCRVNNSSQSDQEASVENIFHGTVSDNEPSTVKQLSSQFAEIESAPFHFKDHEFGDAFFLNQAVPVVSEGYLPHDLNGFSPETPAIDTGMLYFDGNFWNDPTHV